MSPIFSECENTLLKWNALILSLIQLLSICPWLFDEHSQSAPRFGLWMTWMSVPRSPLICCHVWRSSTTLWADFCQWHHRQKRAESSGWFELDYHKVLGKIWCNISASYVWPSGMKTKIRRPHTIRLYSRSNSLQLVRLTGEKKYHACSESMTLPHTQMIMTTTH